MSNYANFGCSITEYIFKLAYPRPIDLFFFDNKFAYPKECFYSEKEWDWIERYAVHNIF